MFVSWYYLHNNVLLRSPTRGKRPLVSDDGNMDATFELFCMLYDHMICFRVKYSTNLIYSWKSTLIAFCRVCAEVANNSGFHCPLNVIVLLDACMLSYAAFLQHPLATRAGVRLAVLGSMCVCVCVVFDSSPPQPYPFARFAFSMMLHGFFLVCCDSLYLLTLSLLWSLFVCNCVNVYCFVLCS